MHFTHACASEQAAEVVPAMATARCLPSLVVAYLRVLARTCRPCGQYLESRLLPEVESPTPSASNRCHCFHASYGLSVVPVFLC